MRINGIYFLFLLFLLSCNQKQKDEETILTGTTTVFVDETVTPIIEDQVAVFEGEYEAKINIISKSETEVVNHLLSKEAKIAVLSRSLTKDEIEFFKQNNINPKITKIAVDAIAFIANKKRSDTLLNLENVKSVVKGINVPTIKGIVFDNPNSSTVRYIKQLAEVDSLSDKQVFSFATNEDVIKYVSENDGMIGVVGVNWLYQPTANIEKYMTKVNILSVKDPKSQNYYSPTQDAIGSLQYPLRRDLYIINCQGFSGLGIGFASFVAGYTGQRIILKSGLVPIQVPPRAIRIVK